MTYAMTRREQQTLSLITASIENTGVAPSFKDLLSALNLRSKSNIHRILESLEQRGHIHRLKAHARAIKLGPAPKAKYGRCPHCRWKIEVAA